jgi:FixJ family two-component response regulator
MSQDQDFEGGGALRLRDEPDEEAADKLVAGSNPAPTVFVIDDDPSVLRALTRLLTAAGFPARAFASPAAFLEQHDPATPGCLVLDLALPGLDGLQLQQALTASGCARPIVFITGRGDIPTSVRAMKAGAVDFLTKPVDDEDLLAAVRNAVEMDRLARAAQAELDAFKQRLATLTPREREVLAHVVAGRLNKQIAADLGTVEKTIKVHRARVMEKMAAPSLAGLVRIAERLGIAPAGPPSTRRPLPEDTPSR